MDDHIRIAVPLWCSERILQHSCPHNFALRNTLQKGSIVKIPLKTYATSCIAYVLFEPASNPPNDFFGSQLRAAIQWEQGTSANDQSSVVTERLATTTGAKQQRLREVRLAVMESSSQHRRSASLLSLCAPLASNRLSSLLAFVASHKHFSVIKSA